MPTPAPQPPRPILRLLAALALATVGARFALTVAEALGVFSDYHAYYRAATNLRAGADIYAEGTLLVARNSYDFWSQTNGQYVYPPAFAIAFAPLTLLDNGKAGTTWLLVLVLATVAVVWLAARLCGRRVGLAALAAVALPLAGVTPIALGIRYGLVARFPTLLAAVAFAGGVAFVLAYRRAGRRDDLAAGLIALALPATGALALLLALRDGQIDRFLLTLAAPGIVGTVALAWWLALLPRAAAPNLTRRRVRADLRALVVPALPILGATPLLLGLRFGQADLVLLVLTSLSILAHLRGREVLAGVALGAAAAIKPTLALYGLYYLRKRRWTALGSAALTGATLGLAPFALLGGEAFGDWLAISRYFTGDDYPAYPTNGALRGLLLRAFAGGPEHAPLLVNRPLADALWVVAAVAAGLLWWRRLSARPERGGRAVAEWGLTAALILFAAPLSEDIHFVGLLPALALLADRFARGAGSVGGRALALAAPLAFALPLPELGAAFAGGTLPRLLASATYLYGLALTVAALAVRFPTRSDSGAGTGRSARSPRR